MPRLSKRERAIRDLQRVAAGERADGDSNFQRFRECEQLQNASDAVGSAARTLLASGRAGAFTAETHTPLAAPPGWLPPPI